MRRSWCLSLLEAGASADLLTCFPLQNLEFPGTACLTDDTRIHTASPTAARLSPLILAVCKRNYAVVKMLLRAGADINFRDGQQRTALMYAVRLVRGSSLIPCLLVVATSLSVAGLVSCALCPEQWLRGRQKQRNLKKESFLCVLRIPGWRNCRAPAQLNHSPRCKTAI